MHPANGNARKSANATLAAALTFAALSFTVTEASAVSGRVKLACASDYFAYCSQHAVGSPGVRQCMRANGEKLSKRCVNALIAEGEVSEAEVARRAASLR
jgi:hypothetical protein